MAGWFITLEGGEGAGKSSQAAILATALAGQGRTVLRTREPGGAPLAETVRALLLAHAGWDPLSEALLHFAARREHLVGTIRPALGRGEVVVCDRFVDSTRAYQGGGQGLERGTIEALAALTLDGVVPDLTVILDLDPATSRARAAARGLPDRYEALDDAFHARVRSAFLAIAAAEPERCVVIDATGPKAGVAAAVLATVTARLGPTP